MPKFTLSAKCTISLYTEVEAETKEEALELAEQRPLCSVDDPSRHGEDPDEYWVHSGELDGDPVDISVDDE